MAFEFRVLVDENMKAAVAEQLSQNNIVSDRVVDVLPEGTLDPEVLEFAYTNGYVLLTHDQRIVTHIADRYSAGKEHSGVIIATNRYQGEKGVGAIVTYVVELADYVQADVLTRDDIYNRIYYVE